VKTLQAESALEWNAAEKGATGVKTKCGRYACSRVTVNGVRSYELYKQVEGRFQPFKQGLDNFLQAQKLAELDAAKEGP
jgi:hypothetical protein